MLLLSPWFLWRSVAGTPVGGRWECIPADRRALVVRCHHVICGGCSLLCTPVGGCWGSRPAGRRETSRGVGGAGWEGEWRQGQVVSWDVEK